MDGAETELPGLLLNGKLTELWHVLLTCFF